jgi:hypothetical protein
MIGKSPITLRFAEGEEPEGYTQGHLSIHLDRSVSTSDFDQTCMVLVAGEMLLGDLVAMFGPRRLSPAIFMPVEATRLELKLERVGEELKVSDAHGVVGQINALRFIDATLQQIEALARLCPPDPENGALEEATTARAEVEALFPAIRSGAGRT